MPKLGHDGPLAEPQQQQLRCSRCHRRLADYVDKIQHGSVVLEVQCRCGAANSLTISR
jgi:hypothetical protein